MSDPDLYPSPRLRRCKHISRWLIIWSWTKTRCSTENPNCVGRAGGLIIHWYHTYLCAYLSVVAHGLQRGPSDFPNHIIISLNCDISHYAPPHHQVECTTLFKWNNSSSYQHFTPSSFSFLKRPNSLPILQLLLMKKRTPLDDAPYRHYLTLIHDWTFLAWKCRASADHFSHPYWLCSD